VGRECWALRVAGWVCADEVAVAGDELLPGVEGERLTVVEDGLEFSGWVELLGFEPGVESGDGYPSEAARSAGSAGSDSSVTGESSLGQDALVDEHGSEPFTGHGCL